MTTSSQPSSRVTEGYPSYGPLWQAYDFPHGGYSGPQLFPPQQFTAYWPSFAGTPWPPPAPPGNNPVIWLTCSHSTGPGELPGAPGRPPIRLPTKWSQPVAGLRNTDVAVISDWPPLPDICCVKYHPNYESDDSSDLARAEGKDPSALSRQNSPWSNLPKGWGSPTWLHSTSGRKYRWLGFFRRSIGPLCGDKTIWNSCEMYPSTGRRRLQIIWRLSGPGCFGNIQIRLNGFSNCGLGSFWRNVQTRSWRRGRREGEATSIQRWIWVSTLAKSQEVTSMSCQIRLSWLWFVECRMATMHRYPAINFNLCTPMWGTGWSWLISSDKIVARKNHTVWLRYSNATRHRNNWTRSICDYSHQGTWWMTLYMVRHHTTVPLQMPSSWNWDTM